MGVYIMDMEMPKSCEKCIHSAWSNFYQIYVCNAVRKNEPVLFDGKQTKSTACVRSARADNCPLVELPPHGRLIDADALDEAFSAIRFDGNNLRHWGDRPNWCLQGNEVESLIDDAPTIIEAEEDE